jgi:hypothetical protein
MKNKKRLHESTCKRWTNSENVEATGISKVRIRAEL